MFSFRLSMFLTSILPYRCRCVNIHIKFRCRYFLDVFSVLFTPSVCWRAAELNWSIPLEILIFRRKPSERTNQALPLASKQKVKLQFFLWITFSTISHYRIINRKSLSCSGFLYSILCELWRLRQLSCQKSVSGKRSFSMISSLVIISSAVSYVRTDTLFNKKKFKNYEK